jgi:hypothetical protein
MTLVTILWTVLVLSQFGYQNHKSDALRSPEHRATAVHLQGKHKLTDAELRAIIEAVQDEIYDYGFEPQYYQIGENLGTPTHWIARLPIYINPTTDDGVGQAIYKLMPYGEVLRVFVIDTDGLVELHGDPQVGFPQTQPSHKTIYMDDDEVCKLKHTWARHAFEADGSPTPDTRQQAVGRQKLRTDFSDWEYKHSKVDPKHE